MEDPREGLASKILEELILQDFWTSKTVVDRPEGEVFLLHIRYLTSLLPLISTRGPLLLLETKTHLETSRMPIVLQ